MTVDEQFADWERRFEEIFMEMMKYRPDGVFCVESHEIHAMARVLHAMLDGFRKDVEGKLSAGLRYRCTDNQKGEGPLA